MTIATEIPAPAPARSPAPAKAKPANPEEALVRALRPKDFGKARLAEAEALQQEFDRVKARYDRHLSTPADRAYASAIQLDHTTPRSLRDFEEAWSREVQTLQGEMNRMANAATRIKAELAKELSGHIGSVLDDLIEEEKQTFAKFSYPYSESVLVVAVRKLMVRFQMEAQRTTTTADVNGSPRIVLVALMDL